MESDGRHVQRLQEELGMQTCSAVSTPYVKRPHVPVASAQKERPPTGATLFRRAAAKVQYTALERPDLSFAPRVAASKMSSPKEGDYMVI